MKNYKLSMTIPPWSRIILVCLALICIPLLTHPQVYTSNRLFDLGYSAYHARNFVDAAVYLYAYIQGSPELRAADPAHLAQVQNAYDFSVNEARQAVIDRNKLRAQLANQTHEGLGSTTSGLTVPPPPLDRASVAPSQTSYPLVCRGGGNMHFTYTPFSNLSSKPQIWVTFSRASQGVGTNWEKVDILQPGECSWLDRAVATTEPDTIALLDVDQFSISWQGGQIAGISSALPHINLLQNAARYQAFDVYNNSRGYFVVTRISQSR